MLAALILALGLTGQPNPETGQATPLTPPVVVLLVVACAALVVRRRAPVVVWLVTLTAAAASVALLEGPAPAIVARRSRSPTATRPVRGRYRPASGPRRIPTA